MAQSHPIERDYEPLPDLSNALHKLDQVKEYLRRKMEKRLARLGDDEAVVFEPEERATLPSMHELDAHLAAGSDEVTPRLRRRR